MRISDRYIGKQVLFGTLYAVMILSVVLLLGRLFQEVRELLANQPSPSLIVRFIIAVMPASLMFTIPWGFLTAVLLAFGRMSMDNEVTSFRMAGMSLVRLALPVFLIGAMFSGICLYLNVNVVPLAKASVVNLLYEQLKKDPGAMLDPGKVQAMLKGDKKLFVEAKDAKGLAGFHFYQLKGDDGPAPEGGETPPKKKKGVERIYVHATRAKQVVDQENNQIRLRLLDSYFEASQADGSVEMALNDAVEPLVLPYDWKAPRTRAGSMTSGEIRQYLAAHPELEQQKKVDFRAEMTKRISFSMACFSFAFIAVPLGLKSRRKDTSSGLILSLLLGAGYFLFTVVASEFETDLGATVVLWLPNVLCIAAGLVLFRKVRFR